MYQLSTPIRTLLIASVFLPLRLFAQLPPLQPEQDCVNAIPVCQSVYVQANSYQGEGANPNEISPFLSCLGTGENNDVWYIFTVQVAGNLCFSIIPNSAGNDYDWALFDLTNHSCADIATNGNIEVACNFAPNLGCGGVTGANGTIGGPCGGQNSSCIPVAVGETYVLNVSNYSSNNSGYTLNFSASTAVIFDNVPPQMATISADCGANLSLDFSENVVCSTVQGTDFLITGPTGTHTVTGLLGTNCAAGGTFEDEYELTLTPPITAPGMYYVSIVDTVEDNCGNVALYTMDSIQITLPNLVATASADTLCQGDSVHLSTPVTTGYTYSWNTGATGATTMHAPTASFTYIVSAVDAVGCVYSGDVSVFVNPTPSAAFLPAFPTVCAGADLMFNYVGNSTPSASYTWNFGGGNISSGSGGGPYLVSWPNAGTATVSLEVEEFGCLSTLQTQSVTIIANPTATFLAPVQTCALAPTSIQYAGTASIGATYTWDFDGGIVLSGTGAGPYQVEWNLPGPKTVCLIVDEGGCLSQLECQTIMVQPPPQAAIVPFADQCFDGNQFQFSFTSPATLSSHVWDFGDGSPANTQASPVHTYNIFGNQTLTLVVTDNNGCSTTLSQPFTVFPPVQAAFNYIAVCEDDATPFLDQSFVASPSSLTQWAWNLGDGTSATGAAVSHTYATEGSFPIQLVVTSSDGCRDTVRQSIEVYDRPEAAFDAISKCEYFEIPFLDQSQFSNTNLSYLWSFGDGATSSLVNPRHLYAAYGTYTVNLQLTNDKGCSDTYVTEVPVYAKPVADYTLDPVCEALPAEISNQSFVPGGGNLTQYEWLSGQRTLQSIARPKIVFEKAGVYPIRLIITSEHGCLDTLDQSLTVYPNPVAVFDFAPGCEDEVILFIDGSTVAQTGTQDQIVDWRWNFGNGQTQYGSANPTQTFPDAGFYQVSLQAVTDKGCVHTRTQELEIYANPPAPEIEEARICFGEQAILVARPGTEGLSVNWFVDANATEPFHTGFSYVTPPLAFHTTYYVEAVSRRGCTSERVPITAYMASNGYASITQSAETVDMPQALIQFGIEGPLLIASYRWNFGDGTTSEEAQPNHEYTFGGRFEVVVVLTTPAGCQVELTTIVEVRELVGLHVPSAFSPNGDGQNDELFLGTNMIQSMSFRVYNRWGQEVFSSQDPAFRWDGRSQDGRMLPEGVYAFHVEGYDLNGRKHTRQGTITLLK